MTLCVAEWDWNTAHIKLTQFRPLGQCHYIVDFSRKEHFTSNPTALHDWQYEGLREKSLNCVGFAWTKEVCMFVCLTAYFVNIVININILILHQDLDDLHLGIDRLWAETALRLEDEGICGKTLVNGDHQTLQSIFNNQNQSSVIGWWGYQKISTMVVAMNIFTLLSLSSINNC